MDKLDRGIYINGVFLNLSGFLAKYPTKVIKLMIDQCVNQHRDRENSIGLVTVKALKALDNNITSGKFNGAFNWVDSSQGAGFWVQLINPKKPGNNNFNLIFDKSFKGCR